MKKEMKKWVSIVTLIFSASNASAQILCDGSGYKIIKANPATIYSIDPNSASPTAETLISNIGIVTNSFAYSLTHGLFFAVDSSGDQSPPVSTDDQNLKSIDENGNTSTVTVTGLPANTRLGTVTMDISYDGFLYVRFQGWNSGASKWNVNNKKKLIKLQLSPSGTSATYITTLNLSINMGADIAIHPTNSNVYSMNKTNIYVYNRNTGALVNTYSTGIGDFVAGSQFFDGEGRLFAWSNDTAGIYQNALVRYTFTSATTVTEDILADTGINGSGDGGGCPASINLFKGVSSADAKPGDTFSYTFTIENGFQDTIVFALEDTMPAGLTIQGSPSFSGDISGSQSVTIGTGDPQTLDITGISIPGTTAAPEGLKVGNITINVKIPNPFDGGNLTNQAKITGFPSVFGTEITSDKDDVSPSEPTPIVVAASPTLTLVKSVTNDNGGTAAANAWMLTATGTNNTLSGTSGSTGGVEAVLLTSPDTLTLAESGGPTGYDYTSLNCTNSNATGTVVTGVSKASPDVTLTYDDDVSCTFTNDDEAGDSDISVAKAFATGEPSTYASGDTVTYTITVSNAGPDTATNVKVTDLPTNLTNLSIFAATTSDCTIGAISTDIICTISSLAKDANETITVKASVP